MADPVKHIQNVSDSIIVCKQDIGGGTVKSFVFKPRKFDRLQGKIVSNGYTTILESDYNVLAAHNHTFKYFTGKNKLLVKETIPAGDIPVADQIAALQQRIADLQGQIIGLGAEITGLETLMTAAEKGLTTENTGVVDVLTAQSAAIGTALGNLGESEEKTAITTAKGIIDAQIAILVTLASTLEITDAGDGGD